MEEPENSKLDKSISLHSLDNSSAFSELRISDTVPKPSSKMLPINEL